MSIVLAVLLRGLGFFKSFIAKHWKALLVIVILAVLYFFIQARIDAYGEAKFKQGVEATLAKMKTEVAKRDVVNRAIEARADESIKGFATAQQKKDAARHAAEDKAAKKIEDVITTVPMWQSQACAITPQIMSDRNAIRALGPKAEGDTK